MVFVTHDQVEAMTMADRIRGAESRHGAAIHTPEPSMSGRRTVRRWFIGFADDDSFPSSSAAKPSRSATTARR